VLGWVTAARPQIWLSCVPFHDLVDDDPGFRGLLTTTSQTGVRVLVAP
jgi:hypothetical protein